MRAGVARVLASFLCVLPTQAIVLQQPGAPRIVSPMRSAKSNAAAPELVRVTREDWPNPVGGGIKAQYIHIKSSWNDRDIGSCGIELVAMTNDGLIDDETSSTEKLKLRAVVSGTLFVHPPYRRQGVAQRLLREAEQTARGWGISEVVLLVKQKNAAALKLYKKLGYRPMPITQEHGDEVCLKRNVFMPDLHTALSVLPPTLKVTKLQKW